jgi:hypothetical protein
MAIADVLSLRMLSTSFLRSLPAAMEVSPSPKTIVAALSRDICRRSSFHARMPLAVNTCRYPTHKQAVGSEEQTSEIYTQTIRDCVNLWLRDAGGAGHTRSLMLHDHMLRLALVSMQSSGGLVCCSALSRAAKPVRRHHIACAA